MLTIDDLYANYSKQLPPVVNVPLENECTPDEYFIHTDATSNINLLKHLEFFVETTTTHTKLCIDLGYLFLLGHYDTTGAWQSILYIDVVELFNIRNDGNDIIHERKHLDSVTFIENDQFSMVIDGGYGSINTPMGNIEVFPSSIVEDIALYNDFRLSLLRSLINAKRITFKNYS